VTHTADAVHPLAADRTLIHAEHARPEAAASPDSLALALRQRTAEAHQRAERHPQQARMVRGGCTRRDYADWLGQMHPVWAALDAGVAALAAKDPRAAAIHRDYHPHAHRVAADLAFLAEPTSPPLAATRTLTDFIAAHSGTPAVLGVWYVLEGSSNGGRFIAKAVARTLQLTGPDGLRGLDPHGEAQTERWSRWKADLDAQPWTPAEREAIVDAAVKTFDHIAAVLTDLEAVRG
jgi:heme oxygenase